MSTFLLQLPVGFTSKFELLKLLNLLTKQGYNIAQAVQTADRCVHGWKFKRAKKNKHISQLKFIGTELRNTNKKFLGKTFRMYTALLHVDVYITLKYE